MILTNQNLFGKRLRQSGRCSPRTAIELDAQYRALREGAGVFERADRRLIAVAGSEAAEYLQGQLTNEVEALAPGEGVYAALLDRKGHLQADMRVAARPPDGFEIDTEAIAGDAILRHLDDVQGRPRRRASRTSPRPGP